jgi:hypothetical protein
MSQRREVFRERGGRLRESELVRSSQFAVRSLSRGACDEGSAVSGQRSKEEGLMYVKTKINE